MSEVDYSKLDLSDPAIQEALRVLQKDQRYNSRLKFFFDNAYDWQRKAIEMTSSHRVTGLICGNQMGKSETACAILACHLTGVYPEWWKGARYDRPVRIMCAGVDSNHNKNVLQERLFGSNNWRMKDEIGSGMIPRDNIIFNSVVSSRGDGIESAKFNHSSGGISELIFRSYSQGRAAAQGFPADIIMIDEQPNDEFWKEALTRTKATKGHVVCSFTPLEGMNHLVEQLLLLPGLEGEEEDKFGAKVRSDGKWSMIRASWHDAPHIPEEDIEEAKRDYTYDYEARVYGIPIVGAGRIYPHKIEEISYNDRATLINSEWKSLIGVDFGWTDNDPSAMVKVHWDEHNDIIYVSEEYKGHTRTDKEFAKNLHYLDPHLPIAWPRDGSKASDWKGGGTIADKLRNDYHLNLLKEPFSNPDNGRGKNIHLEPGFQEINDRFRTNRLKISSECVELLKEIENYGYGKDLQGNSTGKPARRSVDHLCDAMRYAVMTIIQGHGTSSKRQQQIWEKYIDADDFEHHII